MNTTTIQLQVPQQRTASRGALLLGNAFANLIQAFRSAPAEQSAERDLQGARALAAAWAVRDPRSAADLTAAIDRFEQKNAA